MNLLKIILEKEFFYNVNLSNLENVLQRNIRTEPGGTVLEYLGAQILKISFFREISWFTNHGGTLVGSMCIPVCPKKPWICYC